MASRPVLSPSWSVLWRMAPVMLWPDHRRHVPGSGGRAGRSFCHVLFECMTEVLAVWRAYAGWMGSDIRPLRRCGETLLYVQHRKRNSQLGLDSVAYFPTIVASVAMQVWPATVPDGGRGTCP